MTLFIKFVSISAITLFALSASFDSTVSAHDSAKARLAAIHQPTSRLMQQSATGGVEQSSRHIEAAADTGDAFAQARQSMMAATGDEIAAKHQTRLMQQSATSDDQTSSLTRQMSAATGDDSIHSTISARLGINPSAATDDSSSAALHQSSHRQQGDGDDGGDDVKSRLSATGDVIHQSYEQARIQSETGLGHQTSSRLMSFTAPLHRFTSPVQRSVLTSSTAVVTSPLDFERQLSKAFTAGFNDAKLKLVKHATQTRLTGEQPASQSGINRLLQRNIDSPIRLTSKQLMNQLRLAYQLGGLNSINRLIRTASPSAAESSIPAMRVATRSESSGAYESDESSTDSPSSIESSESTSSSTSDSSSADSSSADSSSFDINQFFGRPGWGGGFGYRGFGGWGRPGGFYGGYGYPGFGYGVGYPY